MTTILDKIAAYKRDEVAKARAETPEHELEVMALDAPPVRSFAGALEAKIAGGQWALIAEIKKASPSKGLIRPDFNPPQLAMAYEAGGAACLSVLTDTPSFQGAPEYLGVARAVTQLPALRKDFMVDTYQVAEARAWGADAILIIMAMVDDRLAADLEAVARDWGLDVLAEVHNEDELERALKLKTRLIGINNRDLHSFKVDLATTERLAPLLPASVTIVGESGIATVADVQRLAAANVDAILVGESLVKAPDRAAAIHTLLGRQ